MKKIVWAEPAVIDLDNIHHYIAQDSSFYADALRLEILQAIDQLEQFPKLGRKAPEFNEEKTREIIVKTRMISIIGVMAHPS